MNFTLKPIALAVLVATTPLAAVAYAQAANAAPVADTAQTNPVFRKLDANHDGFVSRQEAKQDAAVNAAFSQADMNKDGKLDEDELIKALSISQRDAAGKIAVEGEVGAKQYAADSEVTARVKSALLREEGLRSLEVSVQTYKGRVQLAGFVENREQVAEAGRIAARASGVKSVQNDLTVK